VGKWRIAKHKAMLGFVHGHLHMFALKKIRSRRVSAPVCQQALHALCCIKFAPFVLRNLRSVCELQSKICGLEWIFETRLFKSSS